MIWADNDKAADIGQISKEDAARVKATPGGDDVAVPPDFMGETCGAHAYGEITRKGTETVMNHPKIALQQSDTLYDLGAGFGRLSLTAATQLGAHRAVGVELSVERVDHGCALLDKLKQEFHGPAGTCEVELRQGDLLKEELSGATVVYIANLCFPPGLQNATTKKLATDLHVGTRVAALQPFFGSFGGKELKLTATTAAEMTWDKEQRVYLYKVVGGTSIVQPSADRTEKWGNGTGNGVSNKTELAGERQRTKKTMSQGQVREVAPQMHEVATDEHEGITGNGTNAIVPANMSADPDYQVPILYASNKSASHGRGVLLATQKRIELSRLTR